jgi:hypothetical protein
MGDATHSARFWHCPPGVKWISLREALPTGKRAQRHLAAADGLAIGAGGAEFEREHAEVAGLTPTSRVGGQLPGFRSPSKPTGSRRKRLP